MKFNLNTPVINLLTNKPMIIVEEQEQKPMMLNFVLVNSLMGTEEDNKTLKAEEKLSRWNLANRIMQASNENKEVDLTVEEVVLLKELVAKSYFTIVAGWVLNYLTV